MNVNHRSSISKFQSLVVDPTSENVSFGRRILCKDK